MGSIIPSGIRWKGNKGKEELLGDPVAERLFRLFSKVKDSPRHIAFKPERLINEVYYICNRFYQEKEPSGMIDDFSREIETDMGWRYATELVMPMAYVVLKLQKSLPVKVSRMVRAIERTFGGGCYWDACQQVLSNGTASMPQCYMLRGDVAKMMVKNPVFIINNVEQLNAIMGNNAKIMK